MIRRALPFGMYEFDTFANFPNPGKHGYIYRAKINNQLFLCDEGTYRPLTGGTDSVYRGIFPSLAALQSAYPTDTTGSFAIADGDLYVYDGGWKTVSEQFNPYLGDYANLAALQTAHPAPISGSIATITGELYIFTTSWVLASQPTVLYRGEYATLTDLQIAHPIDVTGAYANVAGVLYVFDVSWKPVSEPQAFYRGEYANLADLQQAYPTDVDGAYATVAGVMYMYVSGHDWVIVSEPAVPYRGEFIDLDALLAAHSTDVEGATALVQGSLYIYTSGAWTEIVEPTNTPYRGDYIDYAALENAYPTDVDGAYATVAGKLYIYGNGQWNVVSEAEVIYRGQYISLYMLQQAYPTDVTGAYATVGSILYIYDNGWKVVSESEVIYRGEFADLLTLQTAYPTDVTGAYATIAGVLYIYDNGWKAVSEPEVIFRGDFATLALLEAAYPTDVDGAYATAAGTLYIFNSGSWNVVSESTYRGVFPTVAALKAAHPTDVMGALAVVVNVLYVYITDWVEASKSDTAIWPEGGSVRDMIRLVDPDTDEVKWEAFPFTDEEILIIKDRLALKPGMPVNYDPPDGAIDVYQVPDFVGSPYNDHANKAPMEAMEIQIAMDSGFLNLVFQKIFYQDTTVCSPSDFWALIIPSTQYYWRIRYSDTYGVWSYWSDATSFTTMAVFEPTVVQSPHIMYPIEGSRVTPGTLSVITSEFKVYGSLDVHESTDWQLSGVANFQTVIEESQDDATNLRLWQPNTEVITDTYLRARYKGLNTSLKSPWSPRVMVRPKDYHTDLTLGMAIISTGAGQGPIIRPVDLDGNIINFRSDYFNMHPLFQFHESAYPISVPNTENNKAALDTNVEYNMSMLSVQPGYVRCYYDENAQAGEPIAIIWLSPNQLSDFKIHPAFMKTDILKLGKYVTSLPESLTSFDNVAREYVLNSTLETQSGEKRKYVKFAGWTNSAGLVAWTIGRTSEYNSNLDSYYNTNEDAGHMGWHCLTYYELVYLRLLMFFEKGNTNLFNYSSYNPITNGSSVQYIDDPMNGLIWRGFYSMFTNKGAISYYGYPWIGVVVNNTNTDLIISDPYNILSYHSLNRMSPKAINFSGANPSVSWYPKDLIHGYNTLIDNDLLILLLCDDVISTDLSTSKFISTSFLLNTIYNNTRNDSYMFACMSAGGGTYTNLLTGGFQQGWASNDNTLHPLLRLGKWN